MNGRTAQSMARLLVSEIPSRRATGKTETPDHSSETKFANFLVLVSKLAMSCFMISFFFDEALANNMPPSSAIWLWHSLSTSNWGLRTTSRPQHGTCGYGALPGRDYCQLHACPVCGVEKVSTAVACPAHASLMLEDPTPPVSPPAAPPVPVAAGVPFGAISHVPGTNPSQLRLMTRCCLSV